MWWSGDGLCLYAKRLEKGRFVWPRTEQGVAALTPAQLSMLLEGMTQAAAVAPPAKSGQSSDMTEQTADLPDDVASLKRLVVAERAERDLAFAALKLKTLELEKLKLQLMKLRRMQFGRSSEKLDRTAAQLELAIEGSEQELFPETR